MNAIRIEQQWGDDAGAGGVPSGGYVEEMEMVVRHGFVRKVMGVVGVQLLTTFGVILACNLNETIRGYVDLNGGGNPAIFWTAAAVGFACAMVLSCCAKQARTYPNNIIVLSIFTLAEAVVLGVACIAFDVEVIMLAAGITSLVVLGLILFATQSTYDFTGVGPYLFLSLWSMIWYGAVLSFIPFQIADTLYGILGVLTFSMYLVYDVQLIVGGKHAKYRFGVDEWVFASLNIYLDILNLFVRILKFVSKFKKRGNR